MKTHMSQHHIAKNGIGVERCQKGNSDGTTYVPSMKAEHTRCYTYVYNK